MKYFMVSAFLAYHGGIIKFFILFFNTKLFIVSLWRQMIIHGWCENRARIVQELHLQTQYLAALSQRTVKDYQIHHIMVVWIYITCILYVIGSFGGFGMIYRQPILYQTGLESSLSPDMAAWHCLTCPQDSRRWNKLPLNVPIDGEGQMTTLNFRFATNTAYW